LVVDVGPSSTRLYVVRPLVVRPIVTSRKLNKTDHERKGKEVDLYSAFIVVPYTQGAQVQINSVTCKLPYLPLPRKHSPDGASAD